MDTPEVALGKSIVRLHDQEGLPYDVSLEMAKENGRKVALLGIIMEAAGRGLSKRLLVEIADKWRRLFVPSPAEKLALQHLGIES